MRLISPKNLQVDAAAMLANISRANDVILAEAAVFALAKAMPRAQAEELGQEGVRVAVSENKPLIEIVKKLAGDSAIHRVDWQALAKPDNYLGETDKIIDRVLKGSTRKGGRIF